MRKNFFAASVSLAALLISMPVHADKPVLGGDDSAFILQYGGINNLASQHQPGLSHNSAEIAQFFNTNSTAVQEQARNKSPVDFAVNGRQYIGQESNVSSSASQQDNSFNANQAAWQLGNSVSGGVATSLVQTINNPFGYDNVQSSWQIGSKGSSVSQTIGATAPGASEMNRNRQNANQIGQNLSVIAQSIDGVSNNNYQDSTQNGGGLRNSQTATISGKSSNNTMVQKQDEDSHFNIQIASINNGNDNLTTQYQGMDSGFNIQKITIDGSSNGRALQWQGANVAGGTQTITQVGGGLNNQAGQSQGNSYNVATILQYGGNGNQAVQNQGVSPGQTGFMSISSGHVTQH